MVTVHSAQVESLAASCASLLETSISESAVIASVMGYMNVLFCSGALKSNFSVDGGVQSKVFQKLSMHKWWFAAMIGKNLGSYDWSRGESTYRLRFDAWSSANKMIHGHGVAKLDVRWLPNSWRVGFRSPRAAFLFS